jgi:chemotaxis protein methyltransferase CheR
VTISRFFRDACVFDTLRAKVLPAIAAHAQQDRRDARCWSAGCASGEEPYTLKMLWDLDVLGAFPDVALSIVATDVDEKVLDRARAGCYRVTSLRQMPSRMIAQGFDSAGPLLRVRAAHREGVTFLHQDLRSQAPPGPFDLVFCRNLAFTYFAEALQQRVLDTFSERLRPNGYLVVGAHEQVQDRRFVPLEGVPHVFCKSPSFPAHNSEA